MPFSRIRVQEIIDMAIRMMSSVLPTVSAWAMKWPKPSALVSFMVLFWGIKIVREGSPSCCCAAVFGCGVEAVLFQVVECRLIKRSIARRFCNDDVLGKAVGVD